MTGVAQLVVDAGRPFFDPLGKARAGRVIAEDTFQTDNGDWQQLFTPNSAAGTMWGTVSRVKGRGPARMVVRTPNVISVGAMAIKRVSNVNGDGRYLLELMLSVENVTALTDRPRFFEFGLDTCLADGTRRFFKARFLNYDETGSAQVQKWQLSTGNTASPVYVDVPNGGYPWMVVTNENKALPLYLALIVNTATGLYEGFRFANDVSAGSLNIAAPDSSLQALGQVAADALTSFKNGINPCVSITNRTAAAQTASAVGIHYHRLTYLGS